MTNIISLSEKQNEQLKGNSDEDVALAAARRVMEEARLLKNLNNWLRENPMSMAA